MDFKLDDIDKKQPFKAPEGYFEGLPDRIMSRLDEKPAEVTRQRFIQPWVGYAAAACVALLIVSVIFTNRNENTPTADQLLAEVSNDAIFDYLQETEITSEEILEVAMFSEEDAAFIDDEVFGEYPAETIDSIIEDLEFIDQEFNTL